MSTKVVNETSIRYLYADSSGDPDPNNFWGFSLELANNMEFARTDAPVPQLYLNMSVPVENVGIVGQQWELSIEAALQIRNWLDEAITDINIKAVQ